MTGSLKTVTATEFKAKCLRLLDQVQPSSEDLVICKREKLIGCVSARASADFERYFLKLPLDGWTPGSTSIPKHAAVIPRSGAHRRITRF
jgi:hypothetical protein